jgi:carboxymethylenebutenolidase
VCRRFAADGYRTVAPHLFHRTGDPTIPYDQIDQVFEHIGALTDVGILDDVDASLRYLSEQGGLDSNRVGVVGFCMGGTVSLLAARRRALGAAVTFYGGGIADGRFGMPAIEELASDLCTPWLGLFGDLDQGIPVEQVEALRVAAEGAAVATEIIRYADADHGFHCDGRPAYNEASATDAWLRTLAWFDAYLDQV